MKRWASLLSALLTVCGVGLLLPQYPQYAVAENSADWVALFGGQNLDNWNSIGNANWRIEDGSIVADKGSGYLVSKSSYTDFQLRAEFWASDDVNSGIFIRCTDPNSVSSKTSYEVNIFDQRQQPDYGTGALTNLVRVVPMPKAGGKWNVYEITAQDGKLTVILNGQKTVDGFEDTKFAKGRIALQHERGAVDDKGVIKFRKVEIKPL
jgi:Domain of Unknown Function (DUF1080)